MHKKCKTRIKDLTGLRFGNLLVLERAPNKKSWTMWKCLCDCGNDHITYSTHLLKKTITSCGCNSIKKGANHFQWTGYGEISGKKWNSIRRVSKRKSRLNVVFEIDIKYAWDLFLKQNKKCALSGQPIYFGQTNDDTNATASLDRIDPKTGYIDGNVQWVHKDINRMKNIFQQKYFIDMCKMIAENAETSGGCEI